MLLNTKSTIGTITHMMLGVRGVEEFHRSWSQMIEFNHDYLCGPTERIQYGPAATVSDHAFARNLMAAEMCGDWLLMLDTDHQFEPDLAARLVREFEANDLDVLSGLYQYRGAPHAPVWYMKNASGLLGIIGQWDEVEGGPYLVPLAAAGAGCLLVRRRVFERIERELHEPPFMHRGAFSEDHSFFDRCRELGIPIYGCPAIECPHLSVRPITRADYQPDQAALGERIEVYR